MKQLFEYQHSMGLLLLEKKEWSSKYEELQLDFEDANERLRRERNAHLVAMTDVEKREEGLKKAMGIEKQCALDVRLSDFHVLYACVSSDWVTFAN